MYFNKIYFKGVWGIYFQLQVDVNLRVLVYESQDAKGKRLWSYKFTLTDTDIANLLDYIDADDYESYAEAEDNDDYYILEFVGVAKQGYLSCKLNDISPSDFHSAVQCYLYLKNEFFNEERLRRLGLDVETFSLL